MKQLISAAVAAMTFALSSIAMAADYPTRSVTLVVPYSAGGPVDILTRGLAQNLTDQWGVPVVVENKPGANEIIAAQSVARSQPDGYTILVASDPVLSQNQYLYKELPYDAENSFAGASRVARINMALFARTDFPASNLSEFIAYGRAHPGQVAYGSSGVGNITHLAMAWLEKQEEISLTHVPYKGLAPAIQDLLGGQVQVAFGAVSAIEQHVRGGNIKVLAMSGASRAKSLPDVPTFSELGMPDIDANLTVGLLVPRDTPHDTVERIAHGVQTALKNPAFLERYIESVAFEPIPDTPDSFSAYIKTDRKRQQLRIAASGAQLN